LLLNIPSALLCFFIILFYGGISIAGLLIIRKFYPHYRCKLHNDIAGFIFATLGVIYAVLLAFIVVITWQDFDKASDVTSNEAHCLTSLYLDTTSFPEKVRSEIKSDLINYANAIIDDEWQTMTKGQGSAKVQNIQNKLWWLYSSFQPKNDTQKIFLAESVKKLTQASEMRMQRLNYAGSGIHPLLYFVLFVGSLITIGFTMLFGTENIIPHLIMTSLLAAMIAITLFLIIAMDYPFTGGISIKPDVFSNILVSLTK
jgi:hypothetical protein